MKLKAELLDETGFQRMLGRMAHQIIEKTVEDEEVILVGIRSRGVPMAQRLSAKIEEFEGVKIPVEVLDITLYRDDLSTIGDSPIVTQKTDAFDVTGKTVILVDDVIYTGRTTRAAMDAVTAMGRPAKIMLAALADRGHRELPICANFVGKNFPTSRSEVIEVHFKEIDGKDNIELYEK